MQTFYKPDVKYEVSCDESGRGAIISRVYAAAVVLPKPSDMSSFQYSWMRDSKTIKSKKKMADLAEYIKANALYYSVQFEENDVIDKVNILQASMMAMHKCIRDIIEQIKATTGSYPQTTDVHLLIDGNYFKPFMFFEEQTEILQPLEHTVVEQGDGKYHNIAAASILAKHARDSYILELCEQRPELQTKYGLKTNMGYGTAKHLQGIRENGITELHRKSFAPCKSHL
jgi:ribonuclease HII